MALASAWAAPSEMRQLDRDKLVSMGQPPASSATISSSVPTAFSSLRDPISSSRSPRTALARTAAARHLRLSSFSSHAWILSSWRAGQAPEVSAASRSCIIVVELWHDHMKRLRDSRVRPRLEPVLERRQSGLHQPRLFD
jgi:hypothetical protein